MNNKLQSQILKRVLTELKSYNLSLIVSIMCALVTVYFTLRIPILTGKAVDCIIGTGLIDYDGLLLILKKMSVAVAITFLSQ